MSIISKTTKDYVGAAGSKCSVASPGAAGCLELRGLAKCSRMHALRSKRVQQDAVCSAALVVQQEAKSSAATKKVVVQWEANSSAATT